MKIEAFRFADDGDIPNSGFPLIVYGGALSSATRGFAAAFEALYRSNGWGNGWRNGIFPFHHYHSNAHEFLGIAEGAAEVRFGGEAGRTLTLSAGDAVLIPAGVGHKRLAATPELLVVGAYPPGQHPDLCREGAANGDLIRKRIRSVVFPGTDPVAGTNGPLHDLWT
jgi:uncharacterized protein YjlB